MTSGDATSARLVIVSFDIDGTLEDGNPPGPLPMDLVGKAQALGYLVGSSSDRTVREQVKMWANRGIQPDFVGHKHNLDQLAKRYPVGRRIHIGDTDVDAYYAREAEFEFYFATELPLSGTDGWIF